MKKSLLFLAFSTFSFLGFSQNDYIFQVLSPDPLLNIYSAPTQVQQADGWGLVPDLNITENAVTGELVFVTDGTAADSLGCNALVNGADVDGKIAVVYRGSCQFGVKALNAADAGAIAVIIVNNAGGVVGMAPGDSGGLVDVPVVMISNDTGALLKEEILAGNVTAYLGKPNFANNMAVVPAYVLRPQWAAKPAAILQNQDEFSLPLGGYVYNNGSDFQTGITLRATIMLNDAIIYDETASGGDLETEDSVYIALPTFSQESYDFGVYNLTYQVAADVPDEFIFNDAVATTFSVTQDMFSYARWNPDTDQPVTGPFYSLAVAAWDGAFEPCIHFRDPNASRLRADGIVVAATTATANTLADKILEIAIYEWTDDFDVIDPLPPITELVENLENPIAFGEFAYTSNDQGIPVNIDFFDPVILEDNVRYLFCVKSETVMQELFFGYAENGYDYTLTQAENQDPSFILITAETVGFDGFGTDLAPAIGVRLVNYGGVNTSDNDKVDITPYPNPTRDFIAIPYSGSAESATIHIYDLTGRLVKSENANYGGDNMIQIDMNGVTNGSYVFNMQFNDNTSSTFKVVVAR